MNRYTWIKENLLNEIVRVYVHSTFNPAATLVMFGRLTHILEDDSIILEPLPQGKLVKGQVMGVDSPVLIRLTDNILMSKVDEQFLEEEKKDKKGK